MKKLLFLSIILTITFYSPTKAQLYNYNYIKTERFGTADSLSQMINQYRNSLGKISLNIVRRNPTNPNYIIIDNACKMHANDLINRINNFQINLRNQGKSKSFIEEASNVLYRKIDHINFKRRNKDLRTKYKINSLSNKVILESCELVSFGLYPVSALTLFNGFKASFEHNKIMTKNFNPGTLLDIVCLEDKQGQTYTVIKILALR